MNKFLEICFKIGKVIIFLLILLCFMSVIASALVIPNTFKKFEVAIPSFSKVMSNIQGYTDKQDDNSTELYITEFQELSKMFTDSGRIAFWYKVQGIEDEYKLKYIRNARVLIGDLQVYCSDKHCNDYKFETLYNQLMNEYDNEFKRNIAIKEAADAKQKIDRLVAIGSILSSILLFILLITIALLIKIEENTRKV